jgi:hypothetical protein
VLRPESVGEPQIDETGAGDLDGRDVRIGLEPHRDAHGDLARLHAERLGEQHRRIGGDVAMGGIARRLGVDPVDKIGGDLGPGVAERIAHSRLYPLLEILEEVHRRILRPVIGSDPHSTHRRA